MEQPKTFEQALARIDDIVMRLERGDIALDDALAMFEEATSLVRRCETMLSRAQQKITLLTGLETKDAQDQEV